MCSTLTRSLFSPATMTLSYIITVHSQVIADALVCFLASDNTGDCFSIFQDGQRYRIMCSGNVNLAWVRHSAAYYAANLEAR